MSDPMEEDPDDFVFYGSALEPLEQDEVPSKKPIRIEDQIVTDENGKRRFHGAFTGGFSAGYWNSVGSKEGWRPAEFKSSRSNRQAREQKPEDFMDEEDLGSFGIAPQVLRAKDDFGENHISKKRTRTVLASKGAIPGLPALHGLLNPVRETIGVKLLRSMGWRPNQGAGERLTRREKKERRRKNQQWQSYGCPLPPGLKTQQSDGESESSEEDEVLVAPDDIPTFTVRPKVDTFGLGYSGLAPRGNQTDPSTARSPFVLFEPTLSLTDKRKKLQIKGQAFGVGAFEREDDDIYAKDDMSQYDFELAPSGSRFGRAGSSKRLAIAAPDLLEGFVRAQRPAPETRRYPLPDVPRDWSAIHRNRGSRFDVRPATENELKGLGRHDLNAVQRAAILDQVLEDDLNSSMHNRGPSFPAPIPQTPLPPQSETVPQRTVEQQIAALDFDSLITQVKMDIAARANQQKTEPSIQSGVSAKVSAVAAPRPSDPAREKRRRDLLDFVAASPKTMTFQPFGKDADKQLRFDGFSLLKKSGRAHEVDLLWSDTTTDWDKQREKVEFERALELYQPLCGMMQNRFTSAGRIEENIEGGLVANLKSLAGPQPSTAALSADVKEKDPAKRAALRKQFGALTRTRVQWKPDRLLCIRFNVPDPFPSKSAGAAATPAAGGSGFGIVPTSLPSKHSTGKKFSIFDVLDMSAPPTMPTSVATVSQIDTVPERAQLEWNKAESGELQKEEAEAAVSMTIKQETTDEPQVVNEPEEPVQQRPPMDLFKAIFEDSESEPEEETPAVKPPAEKPSAVKPTARPIAKPTAKPTAKSTTKPTVETEAKTEEVAVEEDAYGPRLGLATKQDRSKLTSAHAFATPAVAVNDADEWVEKSADDIGGEKDGKKKKKKKTKKKDSDDEPKKKKKKKSHDGKDKKKKKTKKAKKKRVSTSSSDSSTSSEDDDQLLLQKLAELKKKNRL